MTRWGWSEARAARRAEGGAVAWLGPLCAAVPWLTVGLLLLMMHIVGGTLTLAEGTLFDLGANAGADGLETKLVAVVMPMRRDAPSRGTLVFFDDARYVLGDESSDAALCEQLAERVQKTRERSLLVLADRRVAGGELMHFSDIARKSGVGRLLFAGRREGGGAE